MAMKVTHGDSIKRVSVGGDPDWVCCRCGRPLGLTPVVEQGVGLTCDPWCR